MQCPTDIISFISVTSIYEPMNKLLYLTLLLITGPSESLLDLLSHSLILLSEFIYFQNSMMTKIPIPKQRNSETYFRKKRHFTGIMAYFPKFRLGFRAIYPKSPVIPTLLRNPKFRFLGAL